MLGRFHRVSDWQFNPAETGAFFSLMTKIESAIENTGDAFPNAADVVSEMEKLTAAEWDFVAAVLETFRNSISPGQIDG